MPYDQKRSVFIWGSVGVALALLVWGLRLLSRSVDPVSASEAVAIGSYLHHVHLGNANVCAVPLRWHRNGDTFVIELDDRIPKGTLRAGKLTVAGKAIENPPKALAGLAQESEDTAQILSTSTATTFSSYRNRWSVAITGPYLNEVGNQSLIVWDSDRGFHFIGGR